MGRLKPVLGGVLLFLLIVAIFVGGAAGVAAFSTFLFPVDDTQAPTYNVSDQYIEPVPAEGQIDLTPPRPSDPGERGVVLIDDAHGNQFDPGEISSLKRALIAYGHEVRTVSSEANFEEKLAEADGLVVADPGQTYDDSEIEAVQNFTTDGNGSVLLLGEPNRMELHDFGIRRVVSEINSLAEPLGVTFSADHLYDMENSDGNHRNVMLRPSNHQLVLGIDQTVGYVAAEVTAAEGEPLLTTAPTAQRAAGESTGAVDVAVKDGPVVAVGDTSFLREDRFNVADNEEFIMRLARFLGGAYD